MSQFVTYLLVGAVVSALLFLLVVRRVASSDSRAAAIGMLVLRLVVLTLAGLLCWQAFWQLEPTHDEGDKKDQQPVRVLVLQDGSESMEFQSGSGRPRRALAEDAWLALKRQPVGDYPLEISRYWFAGNVVQDGQEELLKRHSTQLAGALGEVLGRIPCDRLLVISDGASSEGAVPAYLRDWARNRQLELYAICADSPGDPSFDVAVEEIECPPVNPTRLVAKVTTFGDVPDPIALSLKVDGKPVGDKVLVPKQEQSVPFNLPEAATGWHAYEIAAAPIAGEATRLNNRRLGTYRQTPPNRVLLLLGSPRLESMHVARFLKSAYADRLTTMSVYDPEFRRLALQDFQLAVISGVPWSRVPPAMRTLLTSRQLAHLVLISGETTDWTSHELPVFPIEGWLGELNLNERYNQEAKVTVAPGNRQPAFHDLDLDRLTVNLQRLCRNSRDGSVVLTAKVGNQQFPFLVSDSLLSPRSVALLCDTTWKWSMNPDARVRYQYRQLWNTLLAWIIGEEANGLPLNLDFDEPTPGSETVGVHVSPRNPAALPRLREVALAIETGGKTEKAAPTLADDDYAYQLAMPAALPALVWVEASARYGGEKWLSPRKPLVVSADSLELLTTRPEPEILRSLVGGQEGRFAFAGQAQPVLKQIVRPPDRHVPLPLVRRRNPSRELLLATLAVLLISVEWLIERWRYGRAR